MKKLLLLCCALLAIYPYVSSQSWNLRLDFNETGMPGFPPTTTTLVSATTPVFSTALDILNRGSEICTGVPGVYNYTENGGDGIADINVTLTRVTNATNTWTQVEGDYSTISSGSFRSDYTINDLQSKPNDWAYIKIEFEFLGDLSSSICPSLFNMRHTSTNGFTEAYEWTIVSINDELSTSEEMEIANYTNLIYNDLSGSSYFNASGNVVNPTAATNMPLPNGQTISEFITGTLDTDGTPGGMVRQGLWAIDDFNAIVLDGPEAVATNPMAGNGSVDDDQTLNAMDDFGLSITDQIQKITYYFGLSDVAFDTNNNGTTRTNSLPAASLTYFDLGFPVPPTVSSTSGSCGDNSGTATIVIADGSPNFELSGDINASGFSDNTITVSGLAEGTFDFTVTDAKGCQATGSVMVDMDCALPVELTYFKAKIVDKDVLLQWQTSSEWNNAYFEIERSTDGKTFSAIDKVAGNGTTLELQDYRFLDRYPEQGINYYRLKQTDFDGSYEHSSIVVVSFDQEKSESLKIYPSPTTSWLQLKANSPIERMEIWSSSGTLVRSMIVHDDTSISIDVGDLMSGYYILKIKTTHDWEIGSFIKR